MNKFRPTNAQSHIVKKGETLTLIARQYGISINTIVQNNRIQNPDVILVGQNLVINAPSELTSSNSSQSTPPLNIAKNGQYKVLEGDTISRIAKSHGVSNQSLIASNETLDPNKIRPGQIINIPGEAQLLPKKLKLKNQSKIQTLYKILITQMKLLLLMDMDFIRYQVVTLYTLLQYPSGQILII